MVQVQVQVWARHQRFLCHFKISILGIIAITVVIITPVVVLVEDIVVVQALLLLVLLKENV